MPDFEVIGELRTDIQNAINYQNQMTISYTDRVGNYSTRNVSPLEIRGDGVYMWDMDKWGLRLFKIDNIGEFQVLDDTFDKEQFNKE